MESIGTTKKMTWIDLSHEFGENTPRWPGFEPLKKEIKLDFDHYPVKAYTYSFPGQSSCPFPY